MNINASAFKIVAPAEAVEASIQLPASKSISNRALILNALSFSPYPIDNLSDCEDTDVITNAFNNASKTFEVDGAGTAMRFLTAFLACIEGEWIIQGSERMHERPIYPLVDALNSLGASVTYLEKEGFPPLKIKGAPIMGGEVTISGDISSQFTSALLMVAPTMKKGLTIRIENELVSKPYVLLTLNMLKKYGIESKWEDNCISITHQRFVPAHISVESDWTAASYWYEFVALNKHAHIELLGLTRNSLQGDANVVNLFADLGVRTTFTNKGVCLRKMNTHTKKFFHNFVDEPDLVQTFALTCCMMDVPFMFSGVQTLKLKETNRIEAVITELKKLGYVITETSHGMLEWNGERCVAEENPRIQTYDDHRMAMAFAMAAVNHSPMIIEHPRVVKKSYRNFWANLQQAGFSITEHD